jgi:hypothetical protein
VAQGSAEGGGIRNVESEYKSPEQRREEWMREMHYRQRNIVFPETVMNNARFWRNLTSRKYGFTAGQKLCFSGFILVAVPPMILGSLFVLASVVRDLGLPGWIVSLPTLFNVVVVCILVLRAISAVLSDTHIPELPLSARQNMMENLNRRNGK